MGEELKEAKIPKKLARTIGIAVDHRRRNRCTESLQANVNRLKLYKSKLLIFPKKSGKKGVKKGDTPKSELQNVAQNTLKEIIPVPKPVLRVKARAITDAEREKSVNKIMKKARTDKVNGMQHGRFNRVMMKTWLDQAGRKKRRMMNRQKKA